MDKVVARKLRPLAGRMLDRLKRQLANTVKRRHARVILLSGEGLCNRAICHDILDFSVRSSAEHLGVDRFPTVFLIDEEGRVKQLARGNTLASVLELLLGSSR